jgi:hypothetical protein
VYGAGDELREIVGPELELASAPTVLQLRVPDTGGQPIARVGVRIAGSGFGRIELDRLDWTGTPDVTWRRPEEGGTMWPRAWVDGVSHFSTVWPEDAFRAVQDAGTGLLMTGGPWGDLTLEAELTPQLAAEIGLAIRVAGLRRYHALVLSSVDHEARLVARDHARETVLARIPLDWQTGHSCALHLTESGGVLTGSVDGRSIGPAPLDPGAPRGGIGILVTEGRVGADRVTVHPVGAVPGPDALSLAPMEGSST